MKMSVKIEIIPDGNVVSPRGFQAGAVYAGIKHKSKDCLDLGMLFSETVCTAAAVFTNNKIQAAPVILDREKLAQKPEAQAVIVNAGCANACTGAQGMANAVATADLVAKHLGINPSLVQVASTGVIGVQLPMEKIAEGISRIALSPEGGHDFTRAIMTTDTRPKEIAVKVQTGEIIFHDRRNGQRRRDDSSEYGYYAVFYHHRRGGRSHLPEGIFEKSGGYFVQYDYGGRGYKYQ